MNIEDRVTSLEGTISTLSKVATQQLARNRETDERLTMLLGIAAGQERDIKSMLARLEGVEHRLEGVEHRLEGVERHLEGLEQRLEGVEQRLVRLESHIDERFDAIIALVSGNQPTSPMQ
jgi:chromosome segregation ATPase